MPSLLNFTCHATWGSMTSWGMEQINLKLGTDWWSSMTSKIYVKFYAIFVITKIKRKMKELYWFTKVFSVSRPREGNYHCLETHSWYLAYKQMSTWCIHRSERLKYISTVTKSNFGDLEQMWRTCISILMA